MKKETKSGHIFITREMLQNWLKKGYPKVEIKNLNSLKNATDAIEYMERYMKSAMDIWAFMLQTLEKYNLDDVEYQFLIIEENL